MRLIVNKKESMRMVMRRVSSLVISMRVMSRIWKNTMERCVARFPYIPFLHREELMSKILRRTVWIGGRVL